MFRYGVLLFSVVGFANIYWIGWTFEISLLRSSLSERKKRTAGYKSFFIESYIWS